MRVIVVGGGVAGTVSAIALRRIGAEVTVYEAYADPGGQVGSFVSLAVNGLRALESLGCLEAVRRAGFDVARQRLWSASGRLLGDVPRGRLSGDRMRSITLMRGDLVATLREHALRAGATVVTGERLVDAARAGEGVRAVFGTGRTDTADLLVGADGLWSATRAALDSGAPSPAYAGLYSVSGIAGNVPPGPATEAGTFNMVFARNGAFVYLPAPDGSVWWSAQVADPEEPDLSDVDEDRWLRRLGELYRFEEVPSTLLRATTRLHRPTPMHTLAEVPTWHDERVVLLGDAAHPVGAGQGASMAIEDAVVLARHLAVAPGVPGIPDALAGYDRARRARVGKMAGAASANRDAKTAGPIGRRVNDLIMPIFFRHFHERSTAWLYAYEPDSSTSHSSSPPTARGLM
ncbi:NAD(P)/FAD-dependent oxidoreductase [Streptosporangium sp. NPDC023615]|uniref:FAD-dependent oxidoreductase n=1 Tax=Streptosporangium sp. NPDC023615 TaxID=3154794 RepID=UPI00341252E9